MPNWFDQQSPGSTNGNSGTPAQPVPAQPNSDWFSQQGNPGVANTPAQPEQHSAAGIAAHGIGSALSAMNPLAAIWHYAAQAPAQDQEELSGHLKNGEYVKALGTLLRSATPGADLATDAAKASFGNAKKIIPDIQNKDYSGAYKHAIGAVPLVGAPVMEAGERLGDAMAGNLDESTGKFKTDPYELSGAIGNAAGIAGAPVAAEGAIKAAAPVARSAASMASKISGPISNFTKVDPSIAAIRAWSPTPTEYGFEQRLPETLAKIQDSYGQPIKTNVQAIEATQKAMDNHGQAYQAWLDRGRSTGASAPGDAIVDATRKAIPETMWTEDPEVAQAIVDKAQRAYGGKNLTTDQLEKFRKEKTADLKSFYDKNTGNQIASLVGGSPEAVIKAQRDTMANSLYNALDPGGKGAAPRQIQLDRSDMIDVKNAAMRRSNVAIGSKPVSKASAVISAAPKAIQSLVSHPGIGYVKAADISNPATLFAGAVDPWVAKAFEAVRKNKVNVTRPQMPPILPMAPTQNP